MKTGLLQHSSFLEHDNGPGHPERPARLTAISDALPGMPFYSELVDLDTRDATRDELELVHRPEYLDWLEKTKTRDFTMLDPDTRATRLSMPAAVRAAGSAVSAVETAISSTITRSFVLCRPPGHHAEADRAMGFCLLNNAAVAAATAIDRHGLSRVAIVDWDVHHGNGTDHIFTDRSDVLYISIHQYPHYPGTGRVDDVGRGDGEGFTVNVPLPAGSTDADYALVMDRIAVPILREYGPELIIVSAGFDSHRSDPLAGMLLTAAAYESLTRDLLTVAGETASGRIVHLLEGGYDLGGLVEGVGAVLSVLTSDSSGRRLDGDRNTAAVIADASAAAAGVVQSVIQQQSRFWHTYDER